VAAPAESELSIGVVPDCITASLAPAPGELAGSSAAASAAAQSYPARPGPMWVNPPRHDDPYGDIVIMLHPAEAAAAADALAEAAGWATRDGDGETARMLADVADDIEAASVTPAAAGAAGCPGRQPGTRPASCSASPLPRSAMPPATSPRGHCMAGGRRRRQARGPRALPQGDRGRGQPQLLPGP
jgi:hypothetical protein